MRAFVVAVAVACGSVLIANPAAAEACARVIAHRGASSTAPENTVRAINRGVALGAARIEIDIRRTSDGRLVLLHDASLARTTNVEQYYPGDDPWSVAATPYASIRQLDAGSWKDGRYAAVPTVSQALALGAPLLLEPKVRVRHNRVNDLASRGDVVVQTFDVEWGRRFAERYPDVPLWILTREAMTPERIDDWSDWADAVSIRYTVVDPATVAAMHEAGLTVAAWTVKDELTVQSMLAMGVDSIITPDVGEATEWVGC